MTKTKKVSGTDFENHVYNSIRKYYPLWRGWEIDEQHSMRNRWRIDFLVSKGKRRIVIDAKDKSRLSYLDIDQILDYKRSKRAETAIIYTANDIEVSDSIKEYAESRNVLLQWTQWRA